MKDCKYLMTLERDELYKMGGEKSYILTRANCLLDYQKDSCV